MKCFYHNDLDGRCAGAVVAHFTKNHYAPDYFEVDYVMDLPINKIADGEQVFFVDYSFKENTAHILQELIERGCDVVWIDHHTSSINLEAAYPEFKVIKGTRSDKRSGALLTYEWFVESEDSSPFFVQLVSDYDCWKFKQEPHTTHFKLGIETVKYDALDEIWDALFCDDANYLPGRDDTLNKLVGKGRIIKNYIDETNTYYREHFAYESKIAGHKCLVVNKKTNSWVFGEKYNEYPLVMVWVFDGTKYTYSIFSGDPSVDCSKIAESYGGGGHKGAAGFSSDEMLFKKN